jgi:hypothetical protein
MKEVSCVYLQTLEGQQICLELVEVVHERISDQVIQVVGNSYDIFAVPMRDE